MPEIVYSLILQGCPESNIHHPIGNRKSVGNKGFNDSVATMIHFGFQLPSDSRSCFNREQVIREDQKRNPKQPSSSKTAFHQVGRKQVVKQNLEFISCHITVCSIISLPVIFQPDDPIIELYGQVKQRENFLFQSKV